MTDLDRYLTDEVMERAAESLHGFHAMGEDIRLTYVPDYSELGEGVKRSRQHEARAALSAVLPDVIRQAKAEALREAARKYQWGGWARNPQARGALEAKSRQAEHAVKWLLDRADLIEQGGQP